MRKMGSAAFEMGKTLARQILKKKDYDIHHNQDVIS